MDAGRLRRWALPGLLIVVLGAGAAAVASVRTQRPAASSLPQNDDVYTVTAREFVHAVRLSGTVEAVEATTVAAPRLSGPTSTSLVISRLVKAGTRVQPGDLL